MWTMIIKAMLPFAVQLIGKWIGAGNANKDAERYFLSMVNEIEMSGMKSVKLSDDYRRQLDAIKEGDLWADPVVEKPNGDGASNDS